MFNDEAAFQSWLTTFKILYSATFSSFDFSDFENDIQSVNIIGMIFLILYTIIMTLVLINFMIAIVSNTYELIQSQSKGVYLKTVAKVKHTLVDDKYYSALIYSYNPMIVATLPFLIVISLNKSKRLNSFVMHLLYIPVLAFSSLLYFIISLILLPISYFLLILS